MAFKKILLIKLRSMGDTILMTSAIRATKEAFPRAKIDVMVTRPWSELLENNPHIHNLFSYDRREARSARARNIARWAIRLRKERYDCVVNFHASPSSAMLSFATGAPVRSIHFHGHKDRNRYSTVEIPGKGEVKPIVERDMDALRALGLKIPPGILPQITLTKEEMAEAKNFPYFQRSSTPLLGMVLGASRPTKIWPIEYFVEVAHRWVQEKGDVLVFQGPLESEWVSAMREKVKTEPKLGAHVHFHPEVSVRPLAAALQNCKVILGNDSGPRHLAVAVGTPTVTIIGPEHPFEWHPYPEKEHPYLYIKDLPCRKDAMPGYPAWCGLQVCTKEKHRCMREITPDLAFKTCKELVQS